MKTLSLSERHNYILETLRQQGSVSVVDLANQLKVSSVTIRKDLTLLEEKEMLYRTHGSAILINPYINDRHVNEKEKSYPEEKRLIGRYAASLITADDSILIASGTTMHALAREIAVRWYHPALPMSPDMHPDTPSPESCKSCGVLP